jgi:hypothetical protein
MAKFAAAAHSNLNGAHDVAAHRSNFICIGRTISIVGQRIRGVNEWITLIFF